MTRKPDQIAMIDSGMLSPFVAAIERSGGDSIDIADRTSLAASIHDDLVPSASAWEFVETASDVLGDPHFGFHVGYDSPLHLMPNLKHLDIARVTLSEILASLIVDVKRLTNQSIYSLTFDSSVATLHRRLNFEPLVEPSQSDGFLAGLITRIIRSAVGAHWDAHRLNVRVTDPAALPNSAIPRSSTIMSKKLGFLYSFPSEWLLVGNFAKHDLSGPRGDPLIPDLVTALRKALPDRIADSDLALRSFADYFSIPERQLQKMLKAEATSFRSELAAARKNRACQLLAESEQTIADVGRAVGYDLYPSFARAFRDWTGQSPSEYRLNAQTAR